MPRPRARVDSGDDVPSSSKNTTTSTTTNNHLPGSSSGHLSMVNAVAQQAAQLAKHKVSESDLAVLEKRLTDEVDEDFFQEPRQFSTLSRVIDVLGVQMIDDATVQQNAHIHANPAYKALQAQQRVVEDSIEHMAVIHCADLNASVISVGRVARQFNEAVDKVRHLRKHVREIQDSLGTGQTHTADAKNHTNSNSTKQQPPPQSDTNTRGAAAMSLRELWLKKLECEATLSMLEKLDILRAAPARFDAHMTQARIGAAVLTIAQALETMFRDDVAQVQALHKIMEQLMLRKQTAEEVVWETLADVVFLRTGNPPLRKIKQDTTHTTGVPHSGATVASSANSVSSDSRRSGLSSVVANASSTAKKLAKSSAPKNKYLLKHGMLNPFSCKTFSFAPPPEEEDDDNDSVASDHSEASLFSIEGDVAQEAAAAINAKRKALADADDSASVGSRESSKASLLQKNVASSKQALAHKGQARRFMVPIPMMEAEMDLEQDERRMQEEMSLQGMPTHTKRTKMSTASRQRVCLPRYDHSTMALKILVECLAHLKRLDDVERVLMDHVNEEIKQIVQREQARTFSQLEKRAGTSIRFAGKSIHMKDFRRHLAGLLSAFGNVLLRLSHLGQILRHRMSGDRELMQKVETPGSVMRSVITMAHELMQREIRNFLQACLKEPERTGVSDPIDTTTAVSQSTGTGALFSLGVIEEIKEGDAEAKMATATRSNVVEMPTARFTQTVLFSKTKNTPQTRHALTFRRMVARWTSETDYMKYELARISKEDTSLPSFSVKAGESALEYLDKVIQQDLLPAMQEEAVNGTVLGLERRDGFDPVLDRAVYNNEQSNDPQDVDMCIACQSVYMSTGPLFVALHRLPRGGEMYQPVVAVLEHVMLTFLSRIKQQMQKLCDGKTANTLLEGKAAKLSGVPALSSVMERRKPFTRLVNAYADGDMLEAAATASASQSSSNKLAPPSTDTPSQNVGNDQQNFTEEVADGVEGEEMLMEEELKTLQPYFNFSDDKQVAQIKLCSDEELMKSLTLAHSLLKVASLLESRLKVRSSSGFNKPLTSTRPLRESIKSVMQSGLKMAKFCRLDMLFQNVSRLAKVCKSSTLVARDAVRIPSSVNDLGEYLTGASDNLREASGNAVTAYTFSSLEQYIPYCLMQTVRVIAEGKGIIVKAPLTMNGIEALDRSGSVLYRDLKGATAFDNSFWDVELAAISFERSASFMAMMELEMEELVAYYNSNQTDFPESDFILMFSMTGPRRQGDVGRFHMIKRREKKSKSKK